MNEKEPAQDGEQGTSRADERERAARKDLKDLTVNASSTLSAEHD